MIKKIVQHACNAEWSKTIHYFSTLIKLYYYIHTLIFNTNSFVIFHSFFHALLDTSLNPAKFCWQIEPWWIYYITCSPLLLSLMALQVTVVIVDSIRYNFRESLRKSKSITRIGIHKYCGISLLLSLLLKCVYYVEPFSYVTPHDWCAYIVLKGKWRSGLYIFHEKDLAVIIMDCEYSVFSLETKPHNMPLVLHYFFVLANQHYNDIICMHEGNTFSPILLLCWLSSKRDFVCCTVIRWCYNITSLNCYLLANVHVVIILQCSCMWWCE